MGFFDNQHIKNLGNAIKENKNKFVQNQIFEKTHKINIGNIVVYNINTHKFNIIPDWYGVDTDEFKNNYIIIGIVLSIKGDKVTFVYKNFLNAEPLHIPYTYLGNEHIITYISQIFNRYITKFKKQTPPIKKLKKLKHNIIQYSQYKELLNNVDIKEGFKKMSGDERFKIFYNKLQNEYTYINYNGKLQNIKSKNDNENIIDINILGGNFLTTGTVTYHR